MPAKHSSSAKREVRPIGLVVSQGDDTRELEFKQDSIILGSGPTANVRLAGGSVSTIHAIIKLTLDSATLIDLGSESGTFVNGKEIREHALSDGDRIKLGDVEVRVELPESAAEDATTPVHVGAKSSTKAAAQPILDGDPTVAAGKPREPSSPTIGLSGKEVKTVSGARTMATPAPIAKADLLEAGTQPQTPKAKKAKAKRIDADMSVSNGDFAFERPKFTSKAPLDADAETSAVEASPKVAAKISAKAKRTSEQSDVSGAEPKRSTRTPAAPEAPRAPSVSKRPPVQTKDRDPVADAGELPDLDGALAGVELDSAGIPKALLDQDPPARERPRPEARSLQIALYWGDELLDVRHYGTFSTLTLGEHDGNDIVVAADGVPESMVFARSSGGGVQLYIPADFPMEMKIGKQLHQRDALRKAARLQPPDAHAPIAVLDLGLNERVALRFGSLTVIADYVAPAERMRSTLAQRLDQAFLSTLVFVSLFALFTFFMVLVSPRGEDSTQDELFKAQQRFAKLLLKDEQKPPPKKFELSGKQGGQHKDDNGKLGRREVKPRDASASKAGAPKVDPNKKEKDRKIALNSGILGALSGGKSSAVSNVFGPGGLGTGINSALGGLRGTSTGDAGGLGGVGARGTGPGGGGKSLGIGGVGKSGERGTGGLGDVDLGGRGRSERSVEHGKTTVVGGLSQEAIKRVLDRAQSQLRYCYEKELQRTPDLYGKVTVKFTIGAAGVVTDAQTAMTTMANNNVEDCLLRVFRRLKFPEPQGGGVVDVSYPMIYKPQGD